MVAKLMKKTRFSFLFFSSLSYLAILSFNNFCIFTVYVFLFWVLDIDYPYSTFQLFCRDISCYISVVFKALKLKLDTCNILKKCMLNIQNYWNRIILKGTFFFAPIKWATSGLVRSAQNWFQSKRYLVKIIRKKSQSKKSIFTTL